MRTDHTALQWLMTLKTPERQLVMWVGTLEEHAYCMENRPGRIHNNTGTLVNVHVSVDCQHFGSKEARTDKCIRTVVHADAPVSWRRLSKAPSSNCWSRPSTRHQPYHQAALGRMGDSSPWRRISLEEVNIVGQASTILAASHP